mgnify:CR=1 FL=1
MRRVKKVAVVASLVAMMWMTAAPSTALVKSYGTAGCGLGSMLLGDQPGIVQIFAATTNGTFANQTFGITSGTSNCVDNGGSKKHAALFIEVNREALAKDVSRGSGETISNLSAIMGCSDSKAVGTVLQKNFKAIFPNQSVSTDSITDSIFSTIGKEKTLASTCSNLNPQS